MQQMQNLIESAIEQYLPQTRLSAARSLDEAIRYAVFSGGKRIRPILSLLGARIFAGSLTEALPAACAVEFIHTSSLLFDDLPCMDDAKLRRGMPVVHIAFGEDVAVLAALALLNQSYSLFGRTPALIREATACIGVQGMIAGQAFDLVRDGADEVSDAERWSYLRDRNRKTSAMMRLALTSGPLACGVAPAEVEALGRAGLALGEAFQMGDDLLDARRSSQHTGKTAGQDKKHHRPSHGMLDEAECARHMQALISSACAELHTAYGETRTSGLMAFVDAMFQKLTAAEQPADKTAAAPPHAADVPQP